MRLEKGEGETAAEKFDRMAREKLGGGKSDWWSE